MDKATNRPSVQTVVSDLSLAQIEKREKLFLHVWNQEKYGLSEGTAISDFENAKTFWNAAWLYAIANQELSTK
jgi:hypothetical protein